ncbi:pyridoxamine 5'-phosphate oxidase family protein [Mycolicibacterium wolinskyi]|uniref:Pyridoxamine 5'-phosphate oxidase n=1 Tax=Mycolicibacterium wolinskyi TaxID=59750 RepID=A0A1X2FAB2_9MYCO|nr:MULTISPECIES: pyridoxamine 5'-phosphate oxidase family protein [Mycolicibacterium]MCV7285384.1 pyridoxamine 5'-phosphate oxidase family protein [Mycolicibacterium wolinskyi]MCV7295113.1 pyridoxamine 5'-phosphate oxidase family protein [Mycolicibacterium goodii]ORX15355.1 pyridoxamine 5'-phosphate oxidase [Mycolicibacterium wolinskyi]
MASPVSVLSEDESWRLLASVALGRFVTTIGTRLEIFPVNFVVQRRTVLFRTAEGTKLITAVMSDRVLFEADDHNIINGWSVIVRGTAELLESPEDIAAAERAQLLPWTATEKRRFVRITPKEISGRYFTFGSDQTQ